MQDTTLYAQILGVESPWRVTAVTPRLDEGEVERLSEAAGRIDALERALADLSAAR